jgi:hypothetical protein
MFSNYRNVSRRRFLRGVAGTTAAGFAAASGSGAACASGTRNPSPPFFSQSTAGGIQIRVEGSRINVETGTLSATIDKGSVTSLKSKAGGEEFIAPFDAAQSAALQLLYRSEETVAIDESRFGSVACRQVSDNRAEVLFHSWDGDGILAVTADPENGDLILEPSACSSRPGIRACRWNMRGIRPDLELVAPFFQGIKLRMDDALIEDTRWPWPVSWEAGLAILQAASGGFWIHTRDDRYRYKALKVGTKSDAFSLGFDTEAYGPIDDNLAAGGLAWRINVFQGDWKVPAERYREWLWSAYNLNNEGRRRKDWIHDIRFAVSWCPGDQEILDALAKRLDPRKVLLHFPDWRTDPYDENYPSFVASEKGRGFVAKGQAMGFRVMPHFNSIDMDPTHPVYAQVRDFQYRDVERKNLHGWSWYKGRSIGVPESNTNRLGHRDMKVMVKVHPGLSMWRSILAENVAKAAGELGLEIAFLDVTLNTYNLHNCLVEGITPTEGMKRLIDEVGAVGKGLVIGGEGLNEITAQGQSIAQAHLFRSWQSSTKDLERAGGCAFNEFLLGKLCRTIGYSGLGGRNADEELRMRIHQEHGAIPTVTIRSAREIREPNAAVKRLLDRAAANR